MGKTGRGHKRVKETDISSKGLLSKIIAQRSGNTKKGILFPASRAQRDIAEKREKETNLTASFENLVKQKKATCYLDHQKIL